MDMPKSGEWYRQSRDVFGDLSNDHHFGRIRWNEFGSHVDNCEEIRNVKELLIAREVLKQKAGQRVFVESFGMSLEAVDDDMVA